MKHRPKKELGQHFLIDTRIREKIVQACHFRPDDVVIEIGPGQGALTKLIVPQVKRWIGIEKDRDLISPLQSSLPPHAVLIHADFLQWDLASLKGAGKSGNPVKVIGNIPYNISTPIIEKLIEHRHNIAQAYLTVQLEFGQRLAAQPGGKDYGSLTCFTQYYADIRMLFKIKNTCFKPAPKVDSCFIALAMRQSREEGAKDEAFLFQLIQTAFQQRRKTILNALKSLVGKDQLEETLLILGIKPSVRPETLTLSNYIKICNLLMLK